MNEYDKDKDRPESNPSKREYEVGYKKPPTDNRWKKGQRSPNPSGRPKGLKNEEFRIRELFMQDIVVTTNGRKKKYPFIRALLETIMRGALLGNARSQKLLLQLAADHKMFELPPINEIIRFTLNIPNAKKLNLLDPKTENEPDQPDPEPPHEKPT